MICKVDVADVKLMLNTLDKIQIASGIDNADMYAGLGLMLRNIAATAEEVDDGGSDR